MSSDGKLPTFPPNKFNLAKLLVCVTVEFIIIHQSTFGHCFYRIVLASSDFRTDENMQPSHFLVKEVTCYRSDRCLSQSCITQTLLVALSALLFETLCFRTSTHQKAKDLQVYSEESDDCSLNTIFHRPTNTQNLLFVVVSAVESVIKDLCCGSHKYTQTRACVLISRVCRRTCTEVDVRRAHVNSCIGIYACVLQERG